ncbi:SLAC1 anion channel family protein [Campylobacter sp. CCS1377]|uniref:SLAC1 anion channel family protein n=1 Tax=Campylobacter sp. CCS1377 TaxID=3158229 RepID=A0AAU7EAM2_9BACT
MHKIKNFPIMFFAVIMGMGGFSLVVFALSEKFKFSLVFFDIFRVISTSLFMIIVVFYLMKIILYFNAFKAEINHPIKINFTATFSISLLILAMLWKDFPVFYQSLFYIGLVFQTFITFYVISFWIKNNLEIKHSNPAWFIPVVGNLIVVIAGEKEWAWLWYYFSIAMFFYGILFSIIFYRILFHDQLAMKFIPTMFIMLAPPAVGFLSYVKIVGYDLFAQSLFSLTLFFSFLLFFMFKSFFKLKFFLSWWAFTFPSAAAILAILKFYEFSHESIFLYFGVFLFVILCIMMLLVGFYTLKNIINQSIFEEEPVLK